MKCIYCTVAVNVFFLLQTSGITYCLGVFSFISNISDFFFYQVSFAQYSNVVIFGVPQMVSFSVCPTAILYFKYCHVRQVK